MPHKRNPHKSERICSLARMVKSNVIPALDNMILEDERDLTNSANERVIFAENFTFLDYMLRQLTINLEYVVIDEEQIEKNLNLTKGACLAENIMVNLVDKGFGRQESHEILRKAIIKSKNESVSIKELLTQHELIKTKFTSEELDDLLNPHKYIGEAVNITNNLIKYINKKYDF
jgi:adenylosuccinate lyase